MLLPALAVVVSAILVALCRRELVGLNELSLLVQRHRGVASPAATDSELSERRRIADLNEATIELRAGLGRPAWVARRCARAALALAVALVLTEVAVRLGEPGRSWATAVVSVVVAAAAAVRCSAIGRSAERRAQGLRDEWNTLIRRSNEDVPT